MMAKNLKTMKARRSRDNDLIEALRTLLCFLVLMHHVDVLIPDLGSVEHSYFINRKLLQNVWDMNKQVHNLDGAQPELSLAGRFIRVINGYLSVNAFLIFSGLVLSIRLFKYSNNPASGNNNNNNNNNTNIISKGDDKNSDIDESDMSNNNLESYFCKHFYNNFFLRNFKLILPLLIVQLVYRLFDLFILRPKIIYNYANGIGGSKDTGSILIALPFIVWYEVLGYDNLIFTQHYGGHLYIMYDLVISSITAMAIHVCLIYFKLLSNKYGINGSIQFKKRCALYLLFIICICGIYQKWRHFPVIVGIWLCDVIYSPGSGTVGGGGGAAIKRFVKQYPYLFGPQFCILWIYPDTTNQIIPRTIILTNFMMYLTFCDHHILTRILVGNYHYCTKFGNLLVSLGKYTYSTYLWHMIVFRVLKNALYPFYIPMWFYDAAIVILGIIMSFVVGYTSYHLLQRILAKKVLLMIGRIVDVSR